jgi:cytochrome P450
VLPTRPTYDEIDLSSLEFWSCPAEKRDQWFSILRKERPVSFHRPLTFGIAQMLQQEERGFWVLATHELVRFASRSPELFRSGEGVVLDDLDFPSELRESVASFLVMDGERHSRLRKLVSSAFTPRNIARIEAQIASQAKRIVDALLEAGECDFVSEVSVRLPQWTISEMIGIPEGDRDRIVHAANTVIATSDPEFLTEGTAFATYMEAVQEIWEVATEMAQRRRASPQDDLLTALVEVEVDGACLTDEEIAAFMLLLSVAGNDTTRHTISHTMKALCERADQRSLLREDLVGRLPRAVEEMVRWATPVIYFRRSTTQDVTIGDQVIPAGDPVVLLYESANRDEAVFEEPWRFDIQRYPNEHLGFGGGGPHYCLGANLARTQLRCLVGELVTRAPNLEADEPEYLQSHFIRGVKRMHCRVGRH